MAIQAKREVRTLREWLALPVEWVQAFALRFTERLNQELWTTLLVIFGVVTVNMVILLLLLQGANNRAIAFSALFLAGALALRYPEVSVTTFIVVGSGLLVNAFWYAELGGGTGQRAILLLFLLIISAQALFEYIRLPREQRPRIWTPLTIALLPFWLYHGAHVAYLYIFLYDVPPPDDLRVVLGTYQPPLFRYFDGHIAWIGIIPIIILLRDWVRARRVIIALATVMTINTFATIWEYFSPMPMFFKILFQFRAAGETQEGYRIRDPFGLYFSMTLFFGLLYMLGYARRLRTNLFIILYIFAFLFVLIITKNRILWAGVLLFLPFALLWKSPQAFLRQAVVFGITLLVGSALLLHPFVYNIVSRIVDEAEERWSRTFAFGGDPRFDPSYQFRQREREAWEHNYPRLSTFQKLFGAGLQTPYGFYTTSKYVEGYQRLPYVIYFQKDGMHFAWLGRLWRYGWVGIALLITFFITFFIRSIYLFFKYSHDFTYRAIIVGIVGATVGVLAFDSLHMMLQRSDSVPVIIMWSLIELIPHWSRSDMSDN